MSKIIPGKTPVRREPDAKVHGLTKEQVAAVAETLGKCLNPGTGLPVSARSEEHAVFPVAGSVVGDPDGNGKGRCPHCGGLVKLSGKGWVTAHNVRGNPVPVPSPAVRLQERQAEVTDTGARTGSPDASMRDRAAELSGAAGTGTVSIKVKVDGKSAQKDVPNTPENIRTAIRQEQRRKHPDAALLAKLGRMLRGAVGTEAVPVIGAQPGTYKVREAVTLDAPNAPEGREERAQDGRVGHVPTSPGPALVKGANMPAKEPRRTTAKGGPRNAAGWSEPLGRDRADSLVLKGDASACKGKGCDIKGCVAIIGGRDGYEPCHIFRLRSKTQRRHYWQHVTTARKRREATKARVAAYASRSVLDRPGRITDHRK